MTSSSGTHHPVDSESQNMVNANSELAATGLDCYSSSSDAKDMGAGEPSPQLTKPTSVPQEAFSRATQPSAHLGEHPLQYQSGERSVLHAISPSGVPSRAETQHISHHSAMNDSCSNGGSPLLAPGYPKGSCKEQRLAEYLNDNRNIPLHEPKALKSHDDGEKTTSDPPRNEHRSAGDTDPHVTDSALSSNVDFTKQKCSEDLEVEESEEELLRRLGSERPNIFTSTWTEVACCFSICMSQILSEYWVSGFTVILPTVSKALDIPAASSTWPASAFSLAIASFLLVMGRFADMYGGKSMYVLGMAWLTIWSLIGGFSQNELMLDFCRALQGLGPAAFLPSGMSLLGSLYRPGPRKNVVFCCYGACAAAGFFIGILFAGTAAQAKGADWRLYFWVGTALTFITAVSAFCFIPTKFITRNKNVHMDWWGAGLTSSGLILFTFAITDSAHAPQRWRTPYIYVLFIIGVLILCTAGYVECFVAKDPLLPASLFKIKYMPALTVALFLTYGSLGIFLLYATYYMLNILGLTPMQVVAWYTPLFMGGIMISLFGGQIMHRVPGTVLCGFGSICWIIAPLLFALAPQGANYWAYFFTSMVCATLGIDITFNVSNILITSSFPKAQQGLAGSWCLILMHLGIAVLLGFGDVVATFTKYEGLRQSYKNAFWLEVACAAVALVIFLGFVRVEAAESEFTVEEKEERRLAAEAGGGGDE